MYVFTFDYDWLATEMNWCLQETDVPEWMTKGKTRLIQNIDDAIQPHTQEMHRWTLTK